MRFVLPLAAALLPLVAACSQSEPERPRNVLLIGVDSLRQDRLGCYGAERDTSPAIDALAARSVLFRNAYSTAPWTMPATASLLTGLHAAGHGVVRPDHRLPASVETLAELLQARGFVTSGVVSNRLLGRLHAFDQGFDAYDETESGDHAYVSTAGVTDKALAELERLSRIDRPFLLFAFYFDPHYDYVDHPEVDYAAATAGRLRGRESIHQLRALGEGMSAAELDFLRDRYDEEIRHTDAGIGRLLARLEELGLAGDTVVVFVADHGEAFFDHGWLGHTRDLYDELVRVPLVIHDPAQTAARGVEDPVSIVSVLPTVLELAGVRDVPNRFAGPSLAPRMRGAASEPAPIFFEVDFLPVQAANRDKASHKTGVLAGGLKLIRDERTSELELYDLAADPAERANLAPEREAARTKLLDHLQDHETERTPSETVDLSAADVETLKGLGYAGEDG